MLTHMKSIIKSHLDSIPEGKIPLICIIGPTAVGKTALSISLAKAFDGEIISADSRQVYRGMDIGTDKITKEEMRGVPHHMLDQVEPDENFSVYDFKRLAEKYIEEIHARGNIPFVVGGTMLYTDALTKDFDFDGVKPDEELRKELREFLEKDGRDALHARLADLDPEVAKKIHPNNTHYVMRAMEKAIRTRLPGEGQRGDGQNSNMSSVTHRKYHTLKIGLIRPREEIYDRINARVEKQLKDGKLEAEARKMIEKYGQRSASRRDMPLRNKAREAQPYCNSITGLGYRQFIQYFNRSFKPDGTPYTIEDVKDRLQKDTRNFAKRQLSWWKKDKDINWFDV